MNRAWAVLGALLGLLSCTSRPASVAGSAGSIQGTVVDAAGPVALATVRIQATRVQALTDARGAFSLPVGTGTAAVTVSAWKQGCYCAKAERVAPGTRGVRSASRYKSTGTVISESITFSNLQPRSRRCYAVSKKKNMKAGKETP